MFWSIEIPGCQVLIFQEASPKFMQPSRAALAATIQLTSKRYAICQSGVGAAASEAGRFSRFLSMRNRPNFSRPVCLVVVK